MTGETCAAAVRSIRAYRAAHWLLASDDPVKTIAFRAGYDNAQSFGRAFRDIFGVSPTAFRRGRATSVFPHNPPKGDLLMFTVTLRTQDPIRLAGMPHKGAYYEIGRTFEQLSAVFSSRNLWAHSKGMVGVYFDDPNMVAEADLKSLAGTIVGPDFEMPDDLEEATLQGGPHAVIVFEGPYAGLKSAYDYLYGPWLDESCKEPADAPSYEIYLNSPMDTAPDDLRTEICLPLKA